MYKVLIVDDESFIREGLKSAVNWAEMGCEVVAEAADGLEAIQAIDAWSPHIIITDIKMPGLDGLAVTQHAVKVHSQIKVVILSGHGDFEYARQAIKHGAHDFILKPTNYSEVTATLCHAVAAIKAEERRQAELIRFRDEFKSQLDFYRVAFLRKLVTTPAKEIESRRNIRESLDLYGIPKGRAVHLILAKVDDFESVLQKDSEEHKQLMLIALEHQIQEYLQTIENSFLIPLRDERYGMLLIADNPLETNAINRICEELQKAIQENYLKLTLSFGVSRVKTDVSELNKAYLEAMEALDMNFYLGSGALVFYDDYMNQSPQTSGTPYSIYVECYKPILKLLQIGDEKACRKQLEQLFQLFEENQEEKDIVKSIAIELGAQTMTTVSNSNVTWPTDTRERLYLELMNGETSSSYFRILEKFICHLAKEVYKKTRSNHKKIIDQVIELISKHYMDQITLTWMSEKIHLNSSYISRLLKNEYGENFTDLLTRHRMEQAKQILKNPQVKIYEVSEKVGILDAQYFAIKFKKYTGMTPSEYRDNFNDLF